MLLLTEGSCNVRGEEVRALQNLAILAELDTSIGHQFRQIGCLNFSEDTIQVNARLEGHAVDDVDQIS